MVTRIQKLRCNNDMPGDELHVGFKEKDVLRLRIEVVFDRLFNNNLCKWKPIILNPPHTAMAICVITQKLFDSAWSKSTDFEIVYSICNILKLMSRN